MLNIKVNFMFNSLAQVFCVTLGFKILIYAQ